MKVLHNDIKTDNILVECLAPEYKQCRSVLIDFGKACCVAEAKLYHLSKEQKEKYEVFDPLKCMMVFVNNPLLVILFWTYYAAPLKLSQYTNINTHEHVSGSSNRLDRNINSSSEEGRSLYSIPTHCSAKLLSTGISNFQLMCIPSMYI